MNAKEKKKFLKELDCKPVTKNDLSSKDWNDFQNIIKKHKKEEARNNPTIVFLKDKRVDKKVVIKKGAIGKCYGDRLSLYDPHYVKGLEYGQAPVFDMDSRNYFIKNKYFKIVKEK